MALDPGNASQDAAIVNGEGALPRSMRAIVQDAYGSPDVLRLGRVNVPELAPSEVLISVRAAGVDRGTWHLMAGQPYIMRIIGFGFRRPKHRVPGRDVAGTVVAVGSDVTRFRVGDEVFGIGPGSFAEYAVAREDKIAQKPAILDFAHAAVVAISGVAALQGLRDSGRLEFGQKVLITGASGGVGTYAVQIGKALGANVTGVCSTSKVDLVRSIGADHIVDYTKEDFTTSNETYDLIFDIAGTMPLSRLRRTLTRKGTLVIAGGEGGKWTGIGRQMLALSMSPFMRQRLTMFVSRERGSDIDALRQFIEDGTVVPLVDRTYPLAQAAEALRRLESGQVRGKIALTI